MIATGDPDLSGFRDHGGRMVRWHGWSDRLMHACSWRRVWRTVPAARPAENAAGRRAVSR